MGTLVVIEGLDGSGKRTLTDALSTRWRADGRTVATMAFPRYGLDVHADLVQDALYGRLGDLSESVYGPALLFALDRRAAAPAIRELLAANDVLLLDRYVTSNAAYGSARLGGPPVEGEQQGRPVHRFGEIAQPAIERVLDQIGVHVQPVPREGHRRHRPAVGPPAGRQRVGQRPLPRPVQPLDDDQPAHAQHPNPREMTTASTR